MSQNVDGMVRAGVDAYRAGNKTEARALLERAIEIDSYNETAWLWLSAVVDTQEEQQTCLENVLVINPDNSRARQGLKSLGINPESVLADTQDDYEEDVYAVPSSSASIERTVPETSPEEYDDWVGTLNLGADNTSAEDDAPVQEDNTVQEDLFSDVDFSADGGAFSIDSTVFTEDAFTEEQEETTYDDISFDETAFDNGYDDFDNSPVDSGYSDEDLFAGDTSDAGNGMFADVNTLENYNDAVGNSLDYDDSQFSGDEPEPTTPDEPDAISDEVLFSRIPAEIKATRAPGITEKVPQYHYIILGVLALVNVGALAFVGFQFVS